MKRFAWTFLALALAAPFPAQCRADAVSDFYQGKNITLIVGYSVGGGYDVHARALARHMPKHIPGNPRITVQNMPGAGSLVAVNYLYNIAPRDGTVFGTFGRGLAMEPLVGSGKAQFDATKLNWIGSATNELSVCAVRSDSAVKMWEDAMTKEMVVAGEGSGSDPDVFAILMKNLFGAKIKLVSGYPGGAEMTLAIERGEVDGRCGWSWTSIKASKPDWVANGKLNYLLQMSLERNPSLPDVPSVIEKAKSEEQRKILQLVFARQVFGRPFAAPPGVPEERVQALRKAFMATMRDPEYLAEAEKSGLEVAPVSGEEVQKLIDELYATPKEVLEKAKVAINTGAPPPAKH